jgi:hypothetical protein
LKKWANKLNRAFSKEEVQIAKKKKSEEMLNIPGHKGNASQNRINFTFTPITMTTINNTSNNKCWRGCAEKVTLTHCWCECKLAQLL